ncbi:flagellar protein FlaG [Bacillus thuringiensis]|nr:flagellar protein FlaG [Bacillus thuringiensis]
MEINSLKYPGKLPGVDLQPGEATKSVRDIPKEPVPVAQERERIKKELETLNKFMQNSSTHLKFTMHEKLNEFYVQIVDDHTNEVLREVPSRKVLDMVAQFHEMIGLLVDKKV